MFVQCYSCLSENINIKYKKNGYNIYSCNSCSLEFVFPQPSESELEKIYTKSYFDRGDKYSKSNEVNIKNDNKKLSIIKKSRLKGKLLDIGCAKGDFLFLAKKNGFDVTGVEISKSACQSAKSKNLNVYNSDLLSKKFDSNCFDVVTMWDVIEHLKNPLNLISESLRVCKPNGKIYIEAPSERSLFLPGMFFNYERMHSISFYDDPTHLGRPWSPQSLYRLACYFDATPLKVGYYKSWLARFLGLIFLPFLILFRLSKLYEFLVWNAVGWSSFAILQKKNSKAGSEELNYFIPKN